MPMQAYSPAHHLKYSAAKANLRLGKHVVSWLHASCMQVAITAYWDCDHSGSVTGPQGTGLSAAVCQRGGQ